MANIEFKAPNFRGRVSKTDSSKRLWHYIVADSLEAAQEYLEDKGFIVHKVERYDFIEKNKTKIEIELKCYLQEDVCEKCRRNNRNKHKFSDLWTELKDYLVELFEHKCAYCEAKYTHVAFGDVEHYRPKAKVTGDEDHPGYYWLAYEPSNYLPSCQLCNQGSAKANNFPIAGTRAYNEEDPLSDEKPLLLNPYNDDYFEHLKFLSSRDQKAPGKVFGVTAEGRTTVEILRLNREDLVGERKTVQEHARFKFKEALLSEDRSKIVQLAKDCIENIQEYATAVVNEINDYCEKVGYPSPFEQS